MEIPRCWTPIEFDGFLASRRRCTEDLLDQVRREFEQVTELAVGEHVSVRTTLPLPTQVQVVQDSLPRDGLRAAAGKEKAT